MEPYKTLLGVKVAKSVISVCFYQYTGIKCICCRNALGLDLFGRHGEVENHVRIFD